MAAASLSNGKVQPRDTLETRSIFISHSHADRGLAKGLIDLVEVVFSGVVVPFASSDPAPTGGLKPGEEWFSEIHMRLREAEAVWVIATPGSITRPWIYWESGIGRALCAGGVVVVRVGLPRNDVPSPLSAFQSYDGLSAGDDDGLGVMLCKVAAQIGMKLAPILVEKCVADWIALAEAHKPEAGDVQATPSVSPEQLNRLEAVIARLEAAAAAPRRRTSARETPFLDEVQRRQHVIGKADSLYLDINVFIDAISGAPADASFRAMGIDSDGDAVIMATRGEREAWIWLDSIALPHLTARQDAPERTAKLIQDIIELREAPPGGPGEDQEEL